MTKRMLIDAAHPEETRVVVLSGQQLEEFDFETSTKKQIKGNIYLAKVTRVEPSLQAAFVEYGGNRHGFLAFNEIHPDYYRIPVADRQAALAADRAAEQAADEREEASAEAEENLPESMMRERLAEASTVESIVEENGASEPEEAPATEPFEPQDEVPAGEAWNASEPPAATEPTVAAEPPSQDAFATTVEDTAPSELAGGDGEIALSVEGTPPEAAPQGRVEQHEHVHSIETLGGDEIEETRPRARPYRHYKIQEVIKRRQIMLVQVTKEERGNKGAALTTYLSLAGRYCVLMPNTPRGGGVSRKITSMTDRRRLKDLMSDLDVPEGMGVIVRTAGSERSKAEIKRDFEYLLRLWDEIRELTLNSTAPALIYEEGNLIKRTIRDLYARDIDEVIVDGEEGYHTAKAFMKMLMPSHAKRVKPYHDPSVPLFHRFQVETQIDAIHSPVVQLRSGGYIVINPTEALVAIDVNSGRSTKERNIEETALKTNVEAAEEVARQLRLRDLAGLIVIDFIDMEEHRNQAAVERRLKEAMRHDRARIQLGRISPFGLLELSRQRLRPSLLEASTQPCPHCNGTGHIRSTESTALHVLRAIEEEGVRRRSAEISVAVPSAVALYILNQKRAALQQSEGRYGFRVFVTSDDTLVPPAFRLERLRALTPAEVAALPVPAVHRIEAEEEEEEFEEEPREEREEEARPVEAEATRAGEPSVARAEGEEGSGRRRRRRRRRGGDKGREAGVGQPSAPPREAPGPEEALALTGEEEEEAETTQFGAEAPSEPHPGGEAGERKRRRRGRRGGRRRRRGGGPHEGSPQPAEVHGQGNEAAIAAPAAISPEFIPMPERHEDAAAAMRDAFSSAPLPPMVSAAAESVPEAKPGEVPEAMPMATRRAPAPKEEVAAAESERQPLQYNIPPAREVSGPPEKPRRGWWRR